MRTGIHLPPQGATARAIATAAALDAACLLWLAMDTNGPHKPGDAVRFPSAVHLVRLPNPGVQEAADAYVRRVEATVTMWRAAVPDAYYVIGNEVEQEAGWPIDAWLGALPLFAAMVRGRFPGIKLAATPFLAANAARMTAAVAAAFDAVCCHSYWGFEAPANVAAPQWGRNYLPLLAYGKPLYVTEVNASPANRDPATDWHERNRQIAEWIAQADGDGVKGCCIFLADGEGEWAGYDVGPEAAADILAQIPVPPPPPPPENTVYTPSYDPRGYRPLDGRWQPFIAAHNPGEAAAICESYDDACRTIGYDANAAIAQGCVETAVFTSQRWRNAHNAAGIGIYSDGTPDVQFGDVQTGIRAQAELLADYFCGGTEPWGILKRYGFGGMNLGKARLSDMDGVWAADTGYSIAIAGYLNSVLGGDAPAPSSGVTGDRIAAEALAQINHVRSGDYDTRNGDHPWYLWCESFVERVHEHCGLTVAAALSAADQGRAMEAAGRLHRGDVNAPRGAVYFWDEQMWADGGHTAISLGDGTFVGTVSPEGVGIRSGWQTHAGFMGWAYYEGVGDVAPAPQEVTDVHTDGKFDPGRMRRLWDGPKSKAQIKAVGSIDPNRAVDDRWITELKAGRPVGFATSKEEPMPTGGVIRYFSSGFICWYPDGSTSVN